MEGEVSIYAYAERAYTEYHLVDEVMEDSASTIEGVRIKLKGRLPSFLTDKEIKAQYPESPGVRGLNENERRELLAA